MVAVSFGVIRLAIKMWTGRMCKRLLLDVTKLHSRMIRRGPDKERVSTRKSLKKEKVFEMTFFVRTKQILAQVIRLP